MFNTRRALLNVSLPITKIIGKIHAPFTHKRITGLHYYSLKSVLKPGVILLTYTRGEFTNLFIPGEFTHAAMYHGVVYPEIGNDTARTHLIVEAIGKGVVTKDLVSFMLTKDRVVALKPLFCTPDIDKQASDIAYSMVGKPYDYFFDSGSEAFYCSELVNYSYSAACTENKFTNPFDRRDRLGSKAILPVDFYKAKDKFQVLWDSKDIKG